MGESWGELASWLALQKSSPEVIAGGVDDRLQMMIHRDQLRGGTAVGLRLWWQWLPENHLQALRRKTRLLTITADHYHHNCVRNSPFFQLVYPEKPEQSSRWTSGWEQPENKSSVAALEPETLSSVLINITHLDLVFLTVSFLLNIWCQKTFVFLQVLAGRFH